MTALEQDGVVWYVKRAEPNCRRFYGLVLQLTLDGGLDVVHTWGRLPRGIRPRSLRRHFPSLAAALAHAEAEMARRVRRGYRAA